jgi:hypothetical protein
MSNFPLYDTLLKETKNKPLTLLQRNKLILQINSMDSKCAEIVLALIWMHYNLNENKTDIKEIPKTIYGVELNPTSYVKEDVVFDTKNFPNKLLQILFKFTTLNEDHEKQNATKQSSVKLKKNVSLKEI